MRPAATERWRAVGPHAASEPEDCAAADAVSSTGRHATAAREASVLEIVRSADGEKKSLLHRWTTRSGSRLRRIDGRRMACRCGVGPGDHAGVYYCPSPPCQTSPTFA